MKTPRKLPAWTLVLLNQGACPGLGTILSGRWVGWLQTTLMVVGFVLSMGFMIFYIGCVATYLRKSQITEAEFKAQYQPHLWALRWGLLCCAVSWCWALVSSWQIWRDRPRP